MTAGTAGSFRVTGLRRAGAITLRALITACGGISDMIDEQVTELTSPDATGGGGFASGSRDDEDFDEGDPGAFRLASGTWENACTVVSTDEVEAATVVRLQRGVLLTSRSVQ